MVAGLRPGEIVIAGSDPGCVMATGCARRRPRRPGVLKQALAKPGCRALNGGGKLNGGKFNPAAWFASIFVTSRMTSLVILACALLGIFAVLNTPREENPQIVVPAANIYLAMPGASAVEMERLVVQPLEA